MVDKRNFIDGIKSSYPICIAFLFMFFSLGMLAYMHEASLLQAASMSAIIFSVPLQSLVLTVNDLTIISINTLLLNFKFLLMSAMLLSIWNHGHNLHEKEAPDQGSSPLNAIEKTADKKTGLTFIFQIFKKLRYMISLHFVCSSTYMVSMTRPYKHNWSFYLGVSIPSYITAIVATVLGFVTFDIACDYRHILKSVAHIVLPIHFLCLTIKRKQEKYVTLATYLGILLSPLVMSCGMFSIFVWIIIAILISLLKHKQCGSK